MNRKPLISIVIPVYNCEDYLFECVESVINQSYKNIEIILIDDGSNDNSPVICDELERKDGRIKVFHQQNKGSGYTRNVGINMAKGTYITFVDSDDIENKDFVKCLLDDYMKEKVCCSACDLIFFEKKEKLKNTVCFLNSKSKEYDVVDYLSYMISGRYAVSVVNKLYNLSIIKNNKIRFDTDHVFWEDLRFNIDYLNVNNGKRISHKCVPLYYARNRKNSQTRIENPLKEIELLESTKALWTEKKYISNKIEKDLSNLYAKVIIDFFYSSLFGMKEYEKNIVDSFLKILNGLNYTFNFKYRIKEYGIKYFSKSIYDLKRGRIDKK